MTAIASYRSIEQRYEQFTEFFLLLEGFKERASSILLGIALAVVCRLRKYCVLARIPTAHDTSIHRSKKIQTDCSESGKIPSQQTTASGAIYRVSSRPCFAHRGLGAR
jgi:hypothetical protein